MWRFERKYLDKQEILKGILPSSLLNIVTILLCILLTALSAFFMQNSPFEIQITLLSLCFIFSRLIALDLCFYVLPNIYIIPLTVLGLIVSPTLGWVSIADSMSGAALGLTGPLLLAFIGEKIKGEGNFMLGGGDIKLIAAAGAWLGALYLPIFVLLSCFITLAFFSFPKRQRIPFGPGLLLAFFISILMKTEIESLLFQFVNSITLL